MSLAPYYADDLVTLYLGDCREVLPSLGVCADVAVTDPPYAATALVWDSWPDGWPTILAAALPATTSLWCFGSMRMFLDRRDDFTDWNLGEDLVWEKHNGSGATDRGRYLRVHESPVRWWRGRYTDLHSAPPRETTTISDKSTRRPAASTAHRRPDRATTYTDDGTRIARSIRRYPSVRGRGRNETEKPIGLVTELVTASCMGGGRRA